MQKIIISAARYNRYHRGIDGMGLNVEYVLSNGEVYTVQLGALKGIGGAKKDLAKEFEKNSTIIIDDSEDGSVMFPMSSVIKARVYKR